MSASEINLNDASPAAPAAAVNVRWQKGASSGTDPVYGIPIYPVSAHVAAAAASTLGVVKPDGTTLTVASDGTLSVGSIAESQVTNLVSDLALKAPLASPALTGTPTAPTATAGTSTTQIATTAFVTSAVAGSSGGITQLTGDVTTGTGGGVQAATLAAVGTAGTYTKVTTDGKGRVTSGAALTSTDLPSSGVTPGNYTAANITVNAQGQVTTATNGSASGITLQTNAVTNATQSKLNLVAGINTAITSDGSGNVTIDSSPVIRLRGSASSGSTTSVSSFAIPFPAGTVAGDMTIVFLSAMPVQTIAIPSGWTQLDQVSSGNEAAVVFYRVVTSGDISTGSVTVAFTSAAKFGYSIASFIGATGGIRDFKSTYTNTLTSPYTLSTTQGTSVRLSDYSLYFGSNNSGFTGPGGNGPTCTQGVVLNSFNPGTGNNVGVSLYAARQSVAGGTTVTFDYSTPGAGPAQYQALISLIGVSNDRVTSINNLTGEVTLAAGANITLTPVGNTINIAAASSGGGSVTGVCTRTNYSYTGSGRALGTIYQNTSPYPLLVFYVDAGSNAVVAYTDATATPTTPVWSMNTYAGAATPCVFLVMSGNYYKVTGGTFDLWNEYTFNTGTWTASGDVAGSRALSTVYHNTGTGFMLVEVMVSGTAAASTLAAYCDASATPTTQVWGCATTTTTGSVFLLVPPGYYYKVTASAGSVAHWNEYTSSIAVTASANLLASPTRRQIASQTATPPAVWSAFNSSGKCKFAAIIISYTAAGHTFNIAADENSPPVQAMCLMAGAYSSNRCGVGMQLPNEFLSAWQDGGTITGVNWLEYTLG